MVDEYGGLQGLVTLTDVLTSIVGDLPSSDTPEENDIVVREDGSWLVDGSVTIERLKTALEIPPATCREKTRMPSIPWAALSCTYSAVSLCPRITLGSATCVLKWSIWIGIGWTRS
jgi:hypothetical protein